jgi:hypothetical protein
LAVVTSFFGSQPMDLVPTILENDGVSFEIGNRIIQLQGAIWET